MEAKNEVRIGVRELRGKLGHYLKLARDGTTVVVTSRDCVMAELKAPSSSAAPVRQFGRLKGRIHMSDDFIETPDDILDAMES